MAIPILISRFREIIRIPADFSYFIPSFSFFFFLEINKLILKFIQNCKEPRIVKSTLNKEDKIGGYILPSFKTYYKAMVTNTK